LELKIAMEHSTKAPLRLAIIGSGNIAAVHAVAIGQVLDAKLTAVCARNVTKAAELAAEAGAQVFSTLEELLAANIADGVLIATPSGAHAEAALPALDAGLHVLCEKPLEINLERVRTMIATAERNNRILAGFFPLRGSMAASTIRAALDAGRFGRLTFVSARVKWWRDATYYADSNWRGTWALDGGGALINQGIHAVDLLQWFGGEVVEVGARAATLAHEGIEVEDTLAASLRFSHGGLGTLAAATSCYPGLDVILEVSGDNGTAILRNDRIEFWQFREEFSEDVAIRKNETAGAIGGGSSDPRAISPEGHRRQIEDFCKAIRGENHHVIDGRAAGRAVAIIEAAYRSSQSGKFELVEKLS